MSKYPACYFKLKRYLKSGVKHSTKSDGFRRFTSRTVCAKWFDP